MASEPRDYAVFKAHPYFFLMTMEEASELRKVLPKTVKCPRCGGVSWQVEQFQDDGSIRLTCWECDYRTEGKAGKRAKKTKPERLWGCDVCKVKFETEAKMKEHRRSHFTRTGVSLT